jgi:hypothetical protein
MTEAAVEALAQRLDRMERGLRRWRIIGVIGWTLLTASVTVGFLLVLRLPVETASEEGTSSGDEDTVEDEVRARTFVLVDEEGRPRAALAMRPDGTPALAFSNEEGRIIWKAP